MCIFIYLFIYFWLHWVFVAVRGLLIEVASLAAEHGLQACRLSSCSTRAQQLRCTGPAAPRHAGSSWTWARTHAPCTGRRIPNHCATREAL